MRRVADLADKAWKESEGYSQILGALEGKRIEAKSVESTIENLKRHLVELDDSDEWLESNLEQFESKQFQYQQQEEAQKENYMEIKEKIEQARHRLGLKQAECGKFENDKANFERQIERRKNLIREIARGHNIHGFDDGLDQDDIDEFMRKIRKSLKDQNQTLDRAKREAQIELREVQATLNEIGQRKSALQESKNASRRQIASNDKEAATYQGKLNEIDVDEGVQAAIEDIVSRLDQSKGRAQSASWDKEIQAVNAEIRNLEDESSRLNSELIGATKVAGDLARLDHLKKELKERERSLETMKGAHGERLAKIVDSNWKPDTLEQEFQGALDEQSKLVSNAENDRNGVSRELEQVEFRLKNVKKTISQRQTELNECITEIRDAIGDEPEEYPETVKQRQVQLDIARKDLEQYAGVGEYINTCLETAKQTKVCRLCTRGFKNDAEFNSFKARLEQVIKKTQREAEDEDVRRLEEDLITAREASTAYDTWVRLSQTDIPEMEKEEEQYDGERDKLLAELESRDKVVDEKTEMKRDVESLSKTVNTIVKYDSEIKSITFQIQELSSKQQDESTARTLEDIQEEIAATGEKARSKMTLAKLTTEKDQTRTEINNLELQLRDAKSNLDNAKFQLEKKADLLSRMEEYKHLNNQQRESIEKADRDVEDLTPELLKTQAKYDDISQRADSRERELQQTISSLSDSVHQLDLANDEINSYKERDGPGQLERAKSELQGIEGEISQLESEQASITKEINRISSQLKDSENTKRQYSDNLTYRQSTRALDTVTAEIEQLEAQNAEVDRSRFKQ
ncbi:DNA repair protein rad50, partial [Elasticomyces elasticus]